LATSEDAGGEVGQRRDTAGQSRELEVGDACFALESGQSLWVSGERLRQDLDRNLTHPARADGSEDLVRAKS
jgi:hypothetical protein